MTQHQKEIDIIDFVLANSKKGDPDSVLKAYDEYGHKKGWFMALGDVKGKIVEEVISEGIKSGNANVVAEIGGYIGYSAILISRLLPANSKFFTFEYSQEFANLARTAIDHAGLGDKVQIFVGPFSETWGSLKKLGIPNVDIFFIDHEKTVYLSDYLIIERENLVHSGSIVIADNMIYPGAPDYLDYVSVEKGPVSETGVKRSTRIKSHKLVQSQLEYSNDPDAISISVIA
ncbi:hypothetical protein HDU97_008965 [Phlyctochytrium planicorne]|nr:hypothetical protein HDU97_008965 [Phlyctochytrium planicorne]